MSHAVPGAVAVALVVSLMGGAAWADAKVISLREGAPRGEVAEGEPVVREVDCTPPRPSAGARVIGFWAPAATEFRTDVTMYEEDRPTYESTWSIRVEVEEGEGPLYLGLSSRQSVIWEFEGAVERIERVILNGSSVGLGVEGLPAERVGVLDESCHDGEPWTAYFLSDGGGFYDHPGLFEVAAGRPVEILPVTGLIDILRLPSGETRRGERRGIGYQPLRIHEVDLASLVTSRPADRPEVLPGMAGIQQLVARGDLVRVDGRQNSYTVVSQLDRLPNWGGCYILGEGIAPPAGQVYPVCLRDTAGTLLSLSRGGGGVPVSRGGWLGPREIGPPKPHLPLWD